MHAILHIVISAQAQPLLCEVMFANLTFEKVLNHTESEVAPSALAQLALLTMRVLRDRVTTEAV